MVEASGYHKEKKKRSRYYISSNCECNTHNNYFLFLTKHTIRNLSSRAMAKAENKFKSGKHGLLHLVFVLLCERI